MNKFGWLTWLALSVMVAGFYSYKVFLDTDKQRLLIGEASHGHYQIELACDSCHTDPFGGRDSLQAACMNCHKEELEQANDSHPKKKFNDPRNADLLDVIDARYCVSCHTEHQKEQTQPMGLTLAGDYCFYCHSDIGEERVSHTDLAFDSCASAGCHNFHDNRALYEAFLVENAGGDWLDHHARIPPRDWAHKSVDQVDTRQIPSFEENLGDYPEIHREWAASSHADAGVSCAGCHADQASGSAAGRWLEKPSVQQCQACHQQEAAGFLGGKHGMRIAAGLPSITPGEARLPMNEQSLDVQHSCNSCHRAHDFDPEQAATKACLTCHNDTHSLAFTASPHGKLGRQTADEDSSGDTAMRVTCATCHMPRVTRSAEGIRGVGVEHNQNMNLRPNEKMIRSVCMNCHNLEFSIDALADPGLIQNNFSGSAARHIPSIDWALKREARE